jgi:AcrR family transcriptional regulator
MACEPTKNQRRRPKQARSRATCEAILEAASQIIERDGAAGFNTNRVAERAGVSIGTLYQYFPDKHAVLVAAAEREAARTEPSLARRQKALLRALIALVESLGLGVRPAFAAAPSPAQAVRSRKGQPSAALKWVALLALSPWLAPVGPTLIGLPALAVRR